MTSHTIVLKCYSNGPTRSAQARSNQLSHTGIQDYASYRPTSLNNSHTTVPQKVVFQGIQIVLMRGAGSWLACNWNGLHYRSGINRWYELCSTITVQD